MSDRKNGPKVMSLNLRFGLADDGPNRWSLRSVAYPDLLHQYPCDFYAFQEANDFQIVFLDPLLRDHERIGQRQPAPDFWQNNVIFHHKKWRCLHHQHFYLSDTPDIPSQFSGSRWPRQCTLGTFEYHGRRLTVINTHFDFEAEVQRRSAQLICKRLEALSPDWPVILMGDLNAGPGSTCMQVFTSYEDGFNSALGWNGSGTHHSFAGHASAEAIDWILYHGAIYVRDARVVTNRFCGFYPSDHFPVTAEFHF